MSSFTNFFEKLKFHNYSIVTALIVGMLTAIYLLVIVPNNEVKEDANNRIIFKGVERQLKSYIDDKLQGINPEQMDSIKAIYSLENKGRKLTSNGDYYIDKIKIVNLENKGFPTKKLSLTREIYFKKKGDSNKVKPICIQDIVEFDLEEFISRINASSNFKSFFICPVTLSETEIVSSDKSKKELSILRKCSVKEALISQNISPKEEDSLCLKNGSNGPITFKGSSNRFYTTQLRIADTDFTLFFAAGINSSIFKSNVQYIKPNYLIFGLLVVSVLLLGICLIKPIILSPKELLSQMDLIQVVFSIGALIAIFTIFGVVNFWDSAISKRNKSDLKNLVEYIDTSFNKQIDTLKVWENGKIKTDSLNGSDFPFRKLYVMQKDLAITLTNGDSLMDKNSEEWKKIYRENENKISLLEAKNFTGVDALNLKSLDAYFWMDKDGILTASLYRDNASFPRKFNDRGYFKFLQKRESNKVLTGVFSRENNEYQWIYAEKDAIKKKSDKYSEKFPIKGIAFREQFSKEIKLPPDTDFMLVDRNGAVLAQHDPGKKLYQNVLLGSDNNMILAGVLAGRDIKNFKMDYQGRSYRVYAKKLSVPTDFPVYILGIRDLSYLDYLEQFTFINSILIVLAYGITIVLLILIYSSIFYNGERGFFSRRHFYHLFHDYGKKEEYRHLSVVNCIFFAGALTVFLVSSPITALYFCLLLIINTAFINVVVLNGKFKMSKRDFFVIYLSVFIFSFAFPLFLLYKVNLFCSLITVVASHILLILGFLKWKNTYGSPTPQVVPKPKVVQRKVYLRFLTSALTNHFVVFPFLLVCAFYSNEINEYSRYYCSIPHLKTDDRICKTVEAYGCACNEKKPSLHTAASSKVKKNKEVKKENAGNDSNDVDEAIINKLNIGLEDPTNGVVNFYTFKELSNDFFVMIRIIPTDSGLYLSFLVLGFIFILFMAHALLNYYSNRFFFFDLMQVSYAGYYPQEKGELTEEQEFIAEVFDPHVKNANAESDSENRRKTIRKDLKNAFSNDSKNEIIPFFRNEFLLNSELKCFDDAYSKIWQSIPNTETKNVLYDFAQDHFSNYKNKDILMDLMDLGLIDHDELTGRLRIRSESFRKYILQKAKLDTAFVEDFKKESSNGTFAKLRLPLLIIAISLLLLLMYLNRDRYNQIEIFGTSVFTVIALVNKFLSVGKS